MIPSKKACKICGKEFIQYPSKKKDYCSQQCYHVAQRQGFYKWQTDKRIKNSYTCCYCGKQVVRSKSVRRNGLSSENIFCDRQCYDKFRRKNSERKCRYCGKTFVALREKKHAQFCNDDCRRSYFAQNTVSYCLNCGQMFYPWTIDRRNGRIILDNEIKTCSGKCKKEYSQKMELLRREKISLAFTGSGHPNWQGGKSEYRGDNWTHQRFLAKKRDNYICQCCGLTQKQAVKKYGSGLEVHHKKPYVFFDGDYVQANDLENLITLCRSCHQKEEWKYRREHKDAYKERKANKTKM